MILALIIIFMILFVGNFIVQYFAHAVPLLGAIATPLIIICVIEGLITAAFIGVKIYKDLRGKK